MMLCLLVCTPLARVFLQIVPLLLVVAQQYPQIKGFDHKHLGVADQVGF